MSPNPSLWWNVENPVEFVRQYQIKAARRAIAIVNRMKPGPLKAEHSSRVWKNYNRLRAAS